MDVVVFAVHLDKRSFKIITNFCEDSPQQVVSLAVQNSPAILGHKDQMNVYLENAMSAVS